MCITCSLDLLHLQGLVFEEERPPPPNRAPLAPMLEFVSAQTGVPVVAVGGGASLGREPQVTIGVWRMIWFPLGPVGGRREAVGLEDQLSDGD